MTNWTGNITTAQTFADGDYIVGNVNILSGGVVTVNPGATISFAGNYFVAVYSGVLVSAGALGSRITWRASGPEATVFGWSSILFNTYTTGNKFEFCNLMNSSGATAALRLAMRTGGEIGSINKNRFLFNNRNAIDVAETNDVDITISDCYFGSVNSEGTNLIRVTQGVSGHPINIQGCVFDTNALTPVMGSLTHPYGVINVRRNLFTGGGRRAATFSSNSGTANIVNNWFESFNSTTASDTVIVTCASTDVTVVVSGNVFGGDNGRVSAKHVFQNAVVGAKITSSYNDYVGTKFSALPTGSPAFVIIDTDNGSSSDNDYFAGNNGAALGNVDTSESTSSTETIPQYVGLTLARTNALSSPNFPNTIDTISATPSSSGCVITWNSNRPQTSEVYLSEATGISTDTPSTYGMSYLRDDDWADMYGRGSYKDKVGGMIGTAHAVTLDGLKQSTLYYYVLRGVDPGNNSVASSQASFTTTGVLPVISDITLSSTSIKSTGTVTITASITNTPSEAAVEVNGESFAMTNTTGSTYSVTISGHSIGIVSAETVTVFATNSSGGRQDDAASTLTVTKPTVDPATMTHDFTVWIRDALINNITDPVSASRNANSKFVCTSFPQRLAEFPLIVVGVTSMRHTRLGLRSEETLASVNFEVRIFSKSTKQRDVLWDEVYNFLRTYQFGSGESVSAELFDFMLVNCTNIDEDGKGGIHQKVAELSYKIVMQ